MLPPEGALNLIRGHCDSVIEECEDALQSPLITEDRQEDDPEARRHLERAAKAAKTLRDHLDANYEFVNGFAEPKEAESAAT
jgi:hypothetical protein